jgi:hypothetical protein
MQQSQQLKMHIDDLFQARQEFWSDVKNQWPTIPTLAVEMTTSSRHLLEF